MTVIFSVEKCKIDRFEKPLNPLDPHERVKKSRFLIRHAFCASIRLYRCVSPAATTRRHPSFTLGSLGPSLSRPLSSHVPSSSSPCSPTFRFLSALNDSLTEVR